MSKPKTTSNPKPKTTMAHVIAYARRQLQSIRQARIDAGKNYLYCQVERTFAIEGTISVTFATEIPYEIARPIVNVNFPACNKGPLQAAAFATLVQELTSIAVALQVELNEMGPIAPGEV